MSSGGVVTIRPGFVYILFVCICVLSPCFSLRMFCIIHVLVLDDWRSITVHISSSIRVFFVSVLILFSFLLLNIFVVNCFLFLTYNQICIWFWVTNIIRTSIVFDDFFVVVYFLCWRLRIKITPYCWIIPISFDSSVCGFCMNVSLILIHLWLMVNADQVWNFWESLKKILEFSAWNKDLCLLAGEIFYSCVKNWTWSSREFGGIFVLEWVWVCVEICKLCNLCIRNLENSGEIEGAWDLRGRRWLNKYGVQGGEASASSWTRAFSGTDQ